MSHHQRSGSTRVGYMFSPQQPPSATVSALATPPATRRQRNASVSSGSHRAARAAATIAAASATAAPAGAAQQVVRRVVQQIVEVDGQPNQLVSLNVGGTVFAFLRELLCGLEGTRLHQTVVENAARRARDPAGNVFVDRDAYCFGVVLRYLRTGVVHVSEPAMLRVVRSEFEYYGLDAFTREGVPIEVVGGNSQDAQSCGGDCSSEDAEVFVKTAPNVRLFTPLVQRDATEPGGFRVCGVRCSELPASATVTPAPPIATSCCQSVANPEFFVDL